MRLGDVGNIAPIVDWTAYVNNILTEDVGIQVGVSKWLDYLFTIWPCEAIKFCPIAKNVPK